MFPLVDENILERARRGDREAIEAVANQLKPGMVRICLAICGREDVARGVLRFVFAKGVTQYATWNDAAAPARWFYHHALLTARRAEQHQADAANDPLCKGREKDLPYLAMVRAIRQLTRQQAEAVILHYGEGLELRPLAIAMDCSTTAANTHLQGALGTLNAMAGGDATPLLEKLREQHQTLSLPADELEALTRSAVRKALAPSVVKLVLRLIILIAGIVAAIWIYLHFQ